MTKGNGAAANPVPEQWSRLGRSRVGRRLFRRGVGLLAPSSETSGRKCGRSSRGGK